MRLYELIAYRQARGELPCAGTPQGGPRLRVPMTKRLELRTPAVTQPRKPMKPAFEPAALRAFRFRRPGGGAHPTAGSGITKKCPSGQVWTCFESPPGSGQQHCECRTLDIKAGINTPQGQSEQSCPPGQVLTCVTLGGKKHCFCAANLTDNTNTKTKTTQRARWGRFCA